MTVTLTLSPEKEGAFEALADQSARPASIAHL
jgi:hypothetical protein